MSTWDDILLAHADQLAPRHVISPTVDAAVVDAARQVFLQPASGKPALHRYAAWNAAQFIADQVTGFRAKVEQAERERIERERAELAEHGPSDREQGGLAVGWAETRRDILAGRASAEGWD